MSAGPPGFTVDLASGLMETAVTDLALGGSGAVDLTRSFSVGDPALPATASEEPLARHWSLTGTMFGMLFVHVVALGILIYTFAQRGPEAVSA